MTDADANDLLDLFTMLDGARIPGGCDTCDAYQEIVAHAYGIRRATLLKVHHDDDCPTLARYEARGA